MVCWDEESHVTVSDLEPAGTSTPVDFSHIDHKGGILSMACYLTVGRPTVGL